METNLLRAENARLRRLLETHGIQTQGEIREEHPPSPANATPRTPEEKVALFRQLFRGRIDVYPIRWEGKSHPATRRMWEKRQAGYRIMGYAVAASGLAQLSLQAA